MKKEAELNPKKIVVQMDAINIEIEKDVVTFLKGSAFEAGDLIKRMNKKNSGYLLLYVVSIGFDVSLYATKTYTGKSKVNYLSPKIRYNCVVQIGSKDIEEVTQRKDTSIRPGITFTLDSEQIKQYDLVDPQDYPLGIVLYDTHDNIAWRKEVWGDQRSNTPAKIAVGEYGDL
jgi:hypothetical protein